jgi:hypothetical protein
MTTLLIDILAKQLYTCNLYASPIEMGFNFRFNCDRSSSRSRQQIQQPIQQPRHLNQAFLSLALKTYKQPAANDTANKTAMEIAATEPGASAPSEPEDSASLGAAVVTNGGGEEEEGRALAGAVVGAGALEVEAVE